MIIVMYMKPQQYFKEVIIPKLAKYQKSLDNEGNVICYSIIWYLKSFK